MLFLLLLCEFENFFVSERKARVVEERNRITILSCYLTRQAPVNAYMHAHSLTLQGNLSISCLQRNAFPSCNCRA